MKIAVLGFGNVGAQLGKLWAKKGHQVTAGLREGSKDRQKATDAGVAVATPQDAAKNADVVVIALPWPAVESTVKSLPLDGKVVIDAVNPMDQNLSVLTLPAGSAGLSIAQWAKGARVVKAFNTLFAQVLQGGGKVAGAGVTVLIAGDDEAANDTVAEIAAKAGLKPLKSGGLKLARYIEPVAGLNIALGYGRGLGTGIAPTWAGIA